MSLFRFSSAPVGGAEAASPRVAEEKSDINSKTAQKYNVCVGRQR